MEKETKVKKISKKPLIISICSVFVAVVIIATTLLLVFSNNKNEVQNNMFSKNLVAVKFDEGWGYVNQKGEVVIKAQFGEANPFSDNGLALVSMDGYYGYINTKGQYIINPIYTQAKSFTNDSDFSMVKRNSKCGYVNLKGEEVIPCQFEEAHQFANGLALVRIGGKYGFINEKGKFVINPNYDYAESFNNKKIAVVGKLVNTEMMYACLSSNGELLTDYVFNKLYISDKYVITYDGAYYGFCGLDLVPLFKTNYQISDFIIDVNPFMNVEDNLIPFKNEETYKYGFLNMKGQIAVEAKYDIVGNFYNGLAMVKLDNKYGFIDKKGELIVNNEYDIVKNFNNNYAIVGKQTENIMKYGVVNNSGKLVVEVKYLSLGNVSQGLCYFSTFDNTNIGYINLKDEVVIPQVYSPINRYGEAYSFTNDGYVVVKQNSTFGILNLKGEFVVNPYLLDVKY